MSWGFIRLEPGKAPRKVTNTRDDTALKSPFWRDSFKARRCLVPASAFCEPNGDVKPATWHWFAINGEEPRSPFAFAGLWRTWKGPVKKDGPNVDIETYSFMTTTPNALVSTINHERSPVLLTTEDEFETWMRGSPEEAFGLIHEFPAEGMRIVQSGFEKKDLLATLPFASPGPVVYDR
jgi:putative SOS response-associated peptidase YedK